MSVINHSVIPDLVKPANSYAPLDLLDFNLNFQGRKMLSSTVRFQGQLKIVGDVEDGVLFDCMAGAHGVIDSITTSVLNIGQIESIQSYPRMHAMVMNATQSRNDTMNSYNSCELKAPSDLYSNMILKQYASKIADSLHRTPADFSVKPTFCLNRFVAVDSDDNSISFSKSGTVRVSIQLSRMTDMLFGTEVSGLTNYEIINPRIIYQSIPDDGTQAKLQMRVEHSLKTSINSSDAVISTRVPAVCDSFSMSFMPTSHESVAEYNNLAQEALPALTELVFLWNNSSNTMVTYTIRDLVEVTDKYVESLKTSGHNTAHLQMVSANKSFGVGLSFGTFVNLANQSLNIQLACGVSNTNPFNAYMYFHSLIEL
jgi:hypothetical protein